ncbi:MAG TPA: AMP-binding protein, partial [Longimicrobiales bacterium]|nr:AMP-binding protein [Longimicrobiales bacterium]
PNGLEFPVAWLAVARMGALVVPVNPGYGRSDLVHVLRDSGARLAIGGPDEIGRLHGALGECPALERVCFLAPGPAGAAGRSGGGEVIASPSAVDPPGPGRSVDLGAASARTRPFDPLDDLAPPTPVTIQYTSGTTGFPKGCVLTHGYWLRLAATVQASIGLGPGDAALTAQPFHYMDPVWNLALAILAGIPLVILPRFSASTFWCSVKENDVTFFYCIGTMPLFLDQQPEDPAVERGHRVRLALCSGIPPRRHADFERRWGCPWRETYGTTELGVVLLVPPEDAASVGSGAMGGPVPEREVRVVGREREEVLPGQMGELQVRGPDTMLGYWDAAAAAPRRHPAGAWKPTGDLVVRDARGYYHHVGRLNDMIRRGGENIAAVEVEAALCEHPAVRAVACTAVADELRGEEVKAYVELRPGTSPADVPPAELAGFLRGRLAAFKVPRFWAYVEEFPLTPSHKIAKARLAGEADPRAGAFDLATGRWL